MSSSLSRRSRGHRPPTQGTEASVPQPGKGEVVAVVSHTHPSLTKGGAETSAYALFRGLCDIGVNAIFIAACPEADQDRIVLDVGREFAVFYDNRLYDHTFQLAAPSVIRRLLSILRENGTTIVSFHHYLNFGINVLREASLQARTFLTLHEFIAICQHHGQMVTRPAGVLCGRATLQDCRACFPEMSLQQIALRRDLMLEGLSTVNGYISPSTFLARRYVEWGLPVERMHVVENGLLHLPDHAPPPAPLSNRPLVLGFFGQINPFKGVDLLLDAAEVIARIPDLQDKVRLRIHGNIIGQPEQFVRRFDAVRERHAFFSFSGPYNNNNVGQLMAECDYILVPSKWWENSPVVIQEAYSVGRPVICAGMGGMAEKVPDGVAGLNFRPGDSADLVRVIATALVPEIFEKLLRSLPKAYGARTMAARYLEVFADCSSEQSPFGESVI